MFEYYLALIILLLFSYTNYILVKDLRYPPFLYAILWFLLLLIFSIVVKNRLIQINDLSADVLIIFVSSVSAFSMGGLTVYLIVKSNKIHWISIPSRLIKINKSIDSLFFNISILGFPLFFWRALEIAKSGNTNNFFIKLYINDKNLGFVKNFEKAISLCSGDYIALADQDDIWLDNKIEILMNNIGTSDLIYSDVMLIDETGDIVSKKWGKYNIYENSFKKFVFGNTVTGCTVLFHSNLKKQFFPIPSGEKYHDWWLALLASKNNGIKYLDIPLTLYRQHNSQDTGANHEKFSQKNMRFIKQVIYRKNSKRYIYAKMQLDRLRSFLDERKDIFTRKELEVIHDAIRYYDDYIKHFFHIKSLFIAMKYANKIYSNDRHIRLLLRDILG